MEKQARLYLDHAATTPMIAAAQKALMEETARWANPSSPHAEGRASKARIEKYREHIKESLHWDGHIIFTSGASESIAIVMRGQFHQYIFVSAGEHEAVLSAAEHEAVLSAAYQNQNPPENNDMMIPLHHDGTIDLNALETMLAGKDRCLCAIQSVNNETGVIQPLAEISKVIRNHGGLLFADCSQSVGKIALPDADIIALSGHKFGGPPGIGALLIKNLSWINPVGGQEQGYRRGTENGPYIAATSAALNNGYEWLENISNLRQDLDKRILALGGEIIAQDANRISTIASYRMPGVAASAQLIEFDMKGISVSAGSACSSGTLKASHVLKAMGYDEQVASEVIRVSFGPQTSQNDIDRFIACWDEFYRRRTNG